MRSRRTGIDVQPTALFADEIAEGVRRRDPEAITAVYRALSGRLLGFLLARVGDRQVAEDLLEATFVELIERGDSIRGGGNVLKAWLFRAAHFNALDHLRRGARMREDLVEDDEPFDLPDHAPGPEEHALHDALSSQLRAAVDQLSPSQQEVILLRYVAGLSGAEVADVIGKSHTAVRGLQHRGERTLAKIIEAQEDAATWQGTATSQQHGHDPRPST